MSSTLKSYVENLSDDDQILCNLLERIIRQNLTMADFKIWHAHPVWFINGNPIVGYSKQKAGIRLMFWSGADFEEEKLKMGTGKFKDASIFYNNSNEIDEQELQRWLEKSKNIQWDYKNLVKRKGKLEKINLDKENENNTGT
ncbi:DUF1801 domain-containing protein [Amniculibacterium sp. G2-70]|uniref:DUF1801 domain-containing protein n=1 Tax=Amniculibacterium sp. G2-70 TaxID=2767188 RepID=UPI0016545DCD|nr:DUF1801 domain-containing protein [Amniculibacterium sp. G2-70]